MTKKLPKTRADLEKLAQGHKVRMAAEEAEREKKVLERAKSRKSGG